MSERTPSRDRFGYVPCERCGHDCGMDAVVTDDVWRQIAPSGDGMFCLWCMDELMDAAGLVDVPVALYFNGKASFSVPSRSHLIRADGKLLLDGPYVSSDPNVTASPPSMPTRGTP